MVFIGLNLCWCTKLTRTSLTANRSNVKASHCWTKSIYQRHVLPDGQRFRLSYVGSQEPGHHEGQEVLVEGDAAFPQHVLPVAAKILNKLERWLRTDAASCGNPVCWTMVHGIILHHCVGGKQIFSMLFKPWSKQPNLHYFEIPVSPQVFTTLTDFKSPD